MGLVKKTFWYFVGVPGLSLLHSDFPWKLVVCAIIKTSIILVFNSHFYMTPGKIYRHGQDDKNT